MLSLFYKTPLPAITNPDLTSAIDQVKRTRSQQQTIDTAFDLVTSRFESHRFRTYLYLWKAFEDDPNKLWQRQGFLHCHHQNLLLRTLLVKSGWVKEEDIKLGWSLVWYISPHQYLILTLNKSQLALDPWNSKFGAEIGEFATGFGYKSL